MRAHRLGEAEPLAQGGEHRAHDHVDRELDPRAAADGAKEELGLAHGVKVALLFNEFTMNRCNDCSARRSSLGNLNLHKSCGKSSLFMLSTTLPLDVNSKRFDLALILSISSRDCLSAASTRKGLIVDLASFFSFSVTTNLVSSILFNFDSLQDLLEHRVDLSFCSFSLVAFLSAHV